MIKVSTNMSLDADIKSVSIALFKGSEMNLATAITIFKAVALSSGYVFTFTREIGYNSHLNEYYEMKNILD